MIDFNSGKKLQRVLLMFILNNFIPNKEKRELLEIFRVIDYNQDGILDKEELKQGCKAIKDFSPAEVDKLMRYIDQNTSGEINYTDFLLATIDKELLINE